jgi:octaprenyl-diphosphate synthase
MTSSRINPSLKALQHITHDAMEKVNAVVIASAAQPVPLITDITHHIVKSGGKRLRPVLTIACAQLLDYEGERHIPLAAAVELIHTATLLHDDVVDESTMRRGLKTANAVWSNQASVLVGDFLLSRAFQLMVADGSLDVLKLLSDASATISQGEVKQLMASGELETTRETYLDIIYSKTAVLFSAACEIASIIHEKSDARTPLRIFGSSLGIAFQLVDDALDYAANEETLGKAVGDDLREGKMTLPVIDAYKQGNTQERAFWKRVVGEGDYRDEDVAEAIAIISRYGTIESTLDLAKDYAAQAASALEAVNGNASVTSALHDCIAFCTARTV